MDEFENFLHRRVCLFFFLFLVTFLRCTWFKRILIDWNSSVS